MEKWVPKKWKKAAQKPRIFFGEILDSVRNQHFFNAGLSSCPHTTTSLMRGGAPSPIDLLLSYFFVVFDVIFIFVLFVFWFLLFLDSFCLLILLFFLLLF